MRTPALPRGSRWVFTSFVFPSHHRIISGSDTGMLSAAKDMMTSKAAKAYVNDQIKNYGRVEELSIDSRRHRIEVVCKLIGEVSPIGVTIEKYSIEQSGGKTFLQVLDSSATRPWMQAAMRDHLHGRRFELPGWAAAAL
jgi:hypothetical protein